MATTNPVFQVLVSKGNAACLAAGLAPSALAVGQIGIFNYHTGLSVDGTVLMDTRDVFIAVGMDRDDDGSIDDIMTSAGQMIQRKNVTGYNLKCYSPALPKIVDITDFKAQCETEYAIKVEIRSQRGYALHGYNQIAKTFQYMTSCCSTTDCNTCPDGDCNELAVGLAAQINADPEGLLVASIIDYTTTPGTPIVVTDVPTWVADPANADKCLGIRLTSVPDKLKSYCAVNLGYFNPRGTDIIVSPVTGFQCNGTVTVKQDLKFEEGLGYDIAQLEYEAGGFNGRPGPYRTSVTAGMPLESFESNVSSTSKYLEVNLIYDQESVGGWLEYKNNLNTILAIPCADTVTRASFFTFMDRILAGSNGFGALADDAALCDCAGAGTPTSSLTAATDGLG